MATTWGRYACGQLEKGYLPKVATMDDMVWVGKSSVVLSGVEPTHKGPIEWLPV